MKKIYVVGMGPGSGDMMTPQADRAVRESDIIVGYTLYVKLMQAIYPDKEYATTAMTRETERCRMCYELALQGKTVALICSGDAGVYGMASLVLELKKDYEDEDIEIEVIPGITAANSGAAMLGAPLNHDYCLISLSDLLTDWEIIEKRIKAAIEGDFAIAMYNPSSKKRSDNLRKACEIMLRTGASPDRACGITVNIGREGADSKTMTLKELMETETDMFTTVFVGNSQTLIREGKLITPRGYRI